MYILTIFQDIHFYIFNDLVAPIGRAPSLIELPSLSVGFHYWMESFFLGLSLLEYSFVSFGLSLRRISLSTFSFLLFPFVLVSTSLFFIVSTSLFVPSSMFLVPSSLVVLTISTTLFDFRLSLCITYDLQRSCFRLNSCILGSNT